jgi:hypothetical protein
LLIDCFDDAASENFEIVDLRLLNTLAAPEIAGGGILSPGENAQPRVSERTEMNDADFLMQSASSRATQLKYQHLDI